MMLWLQLLLCLAVIGHAGYFPSAGADLDKPGLADAVSAQLMDTVRSVKLAYSKTCKERGCEL